MSVMEIFSPVGDTQAAKRYGVGPNASRLVANRPDTPHWTICRIRKPKNTLAAKAHETVRFLRTWFTAPVGPTSPMITPTLCRKPGTAPDQKGRTWHVLRAVCVPNASEGPKWTSLRDRTSHLIQLPSESGVATRLQLPKAESRGTDRQQVSARTVPANRIVARSTTLHKVGHTYSDGHLCVCRCSPIDNQPHFLSGSMQDKSNCCNQRLHSNVELFRFSLNLSLYENNRNN